MMKLNDFKPLICFLLGAFAAAACILSYLSMQQPGGIEGLRVWGFGAEQTVDYEGLGRVLKDAAMNDSTVILTTLNEAWAEPNSILDLFLESFHIGEQTEQLLKNLVIVAMDPKAFDRCRTKHPHCYYLNIKGMNFAAEKRFMTRDYLEMMWRRLDFLRTVLELRHNFLFTDMDIMWFRSPFQHFSGNSNFMIASDSFNGNSSDLHNYPNNGFVYVKSCEQTIEFYKYWYLARKLYPGDHEQTVLNKMKKDSNFFTKFQLEIKFLDTAYFGGFCQPSKNLNKVCTMHANCCVGMANKLYDLRILLEDWKNYTAQPAEEKEQGGFTWRVPIKCKH
ncbi:uncharacterized protein At4g15970-like isoform X2 [Phoenix dactylifera]|uniref:Uncharacterized protein At4g15970-like isoform X2 n=1 Tax=Phoenix dactylifera TaxID=42345 RepID=A0A8B7CM94_PHODC|nr:uncharacterized protein At4g15970-like isoform X2 [Phoenix dactylifera]